MAKVLGVTNPVSEVLRYISVGFFNPAKQKQERLQLPVLAHETDMEVAKRFAKEKGWTNPRIG